MIHHSSTEERNARLEEVVCRELGNDHVLWQGKPCGVHWTSLLAGEWFPLCFAGFWLGLWVWLTVSSWWQGESGMVFIVLFVMTALPVSFALRSLIWDRSDQHYAVTTQRVVIIEIADEIHIHSLDASSIDHIITERHEGRSGNILFRGLLDHYSPDLRREPSPSGFYNLESIVEPASALAEMLRRAKARAA